jgi:glycosyltransferase involved in cell wall biosynthesis
VKPPLDPANQLPWEAGHVPDLMNPVDIESSPVSLVIPIFNSGGFLEKTLRSIHLSDLRNVQIIVADGGSTDNTAQILEYYGEMFSEVICEPDQGQSDAINKGFSKATGEIYCWLNGDDIFLPYALNHVRNFYAAKNKPDFIVGNAYMTEKDFKPINHFIFSDEKLQISHLMDYAINHLIQPSAFFSKNAWQKCGPLDINDHYAMDADLFISIASNFKGHHLNVDLAYSVYHEECKTRGKRAESITQLAMVQAKHGGLSEARKTLDILVSIFNELVQSQSNVKPQKFSDFQQELYDLVMAARAAS